MTPFSPLIRATDPPPVMEARRWLAGVDFPPERPLINLSQAAPIEPPPEALREAMAEMVRAEADTHLYGPVLGLPPERDALHPAGDDHPLAHHDGTLGNAGDADQRSFRVGEVADHESVR